MADLTDEKFMGEAAGGAVHHPRHYNQHPSGVETIQIIELLPGNLCNAVKYVWRCRDKGAHAEDLKKAAWYLSHELERVEHGKSEDGSQLPERFPWSRSASKLCDRVIDTEGPEQLLFMVLVAVENAMMAASFGVEPDRHTMYVNNVTLALTCVRTAIEKLG